MAVKVARAIGATLAGARTNECQYKGRRAVIKSARRGNTFVGVTYIMLERLDSVIAVFEHDDGTFHIHEVPLPYFRSHISTNSGANKKRVALVSRTAIEASPGSSVGVLRADELDGASSPS
jgi:hypothetical protein